MENQLLLLLGAWGMWGGQVEPGGGGVQVEAWGGQLTPQHPPNDAPGHAAGCPSGVPHLADSGWLPYSCGDGFAWSWGCLSTDVLLPPCISSL